MGSILGMPDVVMPRLSDSMEEGTILKWLKAEGDEVARGDELVEIETDKATMTYEADTAGHAVDRRPGGRDAARSARSSRASAPAARRRAGDGAQAEATQQAEASGNGAPSEARAGADGGRHGRAARGGTGARARGGGRRTGGAVARTGNGGRAKASPVARRIAREQGIDLSACRAAGPAGGS